MGIGVCNRHNGEDWNELQWQFVLVHFGVSEFWSRGVPEGYVSPRPSDKPPTRIATAAELPATPLVVVSSPNGKYVQGTQDLKTFKHPPNAIYLFGGDKEHLSDANDLGGREPDHIVFIPTGPRVMHSFLAAGIVLYDRMVKNG